MIPIEFKYIKSFLLSIMLLFIILFVQCSNEEKIEYKAINFKSLNETVFLKSIKIGGHDYIVVSINDQIYDLNENYDFFSDYDCSILYKQISDTLFIYGCQFKNPLINKFKSKIKFLPLDNLLFDEFYKKRKEKGLTFFPSFKKEMYDKALNE